MKSKYKNENLPITLNYISDQKHNIQPQNLNLNSYYYKLNNNFMVIILKLKLSIIIILHVVKDNLTPFYSINLYT